jgi:hypothetical protein
MSLSRILTASAIALLPLLAGCDGASSAREPLSADSAKPDEPASSAPAAAKVSLAPGAATKAIPAAAQVDGSGILESSFDDIKFPMEKTQPFERSMLTPKAESLLGKRIRIRGYMYPTLRKRGLTQFVLVRDNLECCFGPGAALYDCIVVSMTPGQTAEYSIRPIAVEGTLRLEELKGPDGRTLAIYQMAGEAVK